MADLEERFAEVLHGTARAWRQAVDRRLKSLGLSQASWMTIAVAAKARTPLSQLAVLQVPLLPMMGLLLLGARTAFDGCRRKRPIWHAQRYESTAPGGCRPGISPGSPALSQPS